MSIRYLYAFGLVLVLLASAACDRVPVFVREQSFRVPLPDCWRDVAVRRCFAVDQRGGIIWIDDWANERLMIRRFDGSLVQTVSYRHERRFGQVAEESWCHLVLSLACVPDNGIYVLSGTDAARVSFLDHDGNVLRTYAHLKIPYVSGLLRLCTDQEGHMYVIERLDEVPGRGSPFAVGLTKCTGSGIRLWWLQFPAWAYGFGVTPDGTSYLVDPDSETVTVCGPNGHMIRLFHMNSAGDSYGDVSEVIGIDQEQRIFVLLGYDKRYVTVYDSEGNIISGPQSLSALGGVDRTPVEVDDVGSLYFATEESGGLHLARFMLSD